MIGNTCHKLHQKKALFVQKDTNIIAHFLQGLHYQLITIGKGQSEHPF